MNKLTIDLEDLVKLRAAYAQLLSAAEAHLTAMQQEFGKKFWETATKDSVDISVETLVRAITHARGLK